MNLRRCCILILTLAFSGSLAVLAAETGNPYQAIVTRNMFGLVPIPTGPPPNATPDVPLPKITPNGIMTLFGKLQVLFKVSKPGQAAGKEDSYVMGEGDRQDDIEVEKIDEPSATITFNNHGTIQELALVPGKATGGGAVPGLSGLPGMPGHPPGLVPRIPLPPGGGARFGRQGGGSPDVGNPPGVGGIPSFGSASGSAANSAAKSPPITPEEQVLMIEAQRMKALQEGDPMAKLLPITPMTSQVTGEGGGETGGQPATPTPPSP